MAKTGFVALMLFWVVHVASENSLVLLLLCGAAILAGDLLESIIEGTMFRRSGRRKEKKPGLNDVPDSNGE
jgi:hypothetical protein